MALRNGSIEIFGSVTDASVSSKWIQVSSDCRMTRTKTRKIFLFNRNVALPVRVGEYILYLYTAVELPTAQRIHYRSTEYIIVYTAYICTLG